MRSTIIAAAAMLFSAAPAGAQQTGALWDQVRGTFTKFCVECHGDITQRKGKYIERPPEGFTFVLDPKRLMSERTKERRGRFVVPGAPDRSEILIRVRSDDMPYGADEFAAEPVPDDEKETLRRWIESLGPDGPGG